MNYKTEAMQFIKNRVQDSESINLLKWCIRNKLEVKFCFERLHEMMTNDADIEAAKAIYELATEQESDKEQQLKEEIFK